MANILYRKQKQQKSLDNGVTWIDTGEYRVGDILENPSNCTSDDSKQCRWTELPETEGYYCDGYNKYTVQVEECSENGIIWTRTGAQQRGNTVIENNASDCGYVEGVVTYQCEPIPIGRLEYQWDGNCMCVSNKIRLNNTQYDIYGVTGISSASGSTSYTLSDFSITTLTSCENMEMCGCLELTGFFDTSNVTNMSHMFDGGIANECLNISSFNTSNVTDMSYMFRYCDEVKYLYCTNWNTSNVRNMSYMFGVYNGQGMYEIDITGWNTSNVTNMSHMFHNCLDLKKIYGIEDLNTSNVTDMSSMFYCFISTNNGATKYYNYGIESLDLSNWNTSNVTNVENMFYGLKGLKTLNLSGWEIGDLDLRDFIVSCNNLEYIYLYGCSQKMIDKLNKYKPSNCTLVY